MSSCMVLCGKCGGLLSQFNEYQCTVCDTKLSKEMKMDNVLKLEQPTLFKRIKGFCTKKINQIKAFWKKAKGQWSLLPPATKLFLYGIGCLAIEVTLWGIMVAFGLQGSIPLSISIVFFYVTGLTCMFLSFLV